MGQRTHSLDGAKWEAQRPYQYVTDLRIFSVYRSSEHTLFYGQGIQDDAFGELEVGSVLTKLNHRSITHGDFDILETDPFDASIPYTLYVVNPNDEAGQVSNAITFTESDQIPVLDVRVDGQSVVTDQIAYIDLSGKLDVVASPNKLYGTNSDGRQHMYDLKEFMGVQHVYLNGEELEVIDNSVHIDGVAMDSDVVHKVTTPNVIYATDANGDETTINIDHFATSNDMTAITNRVEAVESTLPNKQDKDPDAVNGNLAIFQNGQTVDGGTSLNSINLTLSSHGDRITKLESDVVDINQDISDLNITIGDIQSSIGSIDSELENSLAKDWKATSGGHAILNHPVEPDLRSITITNLPIGDEETYRAYSSEVILSINPASGAAGAVLIGSNNSAAANGVSIGSSSSAGSSAIAMGQMSSASGGSSVAIGESASSSSADSVAIGHSASVSGDRSVAIGSGSLADDDDVVSVGFDDASGRSPIYRRVTAVKDPENDHDAATKNYVDSNDLGSMSHPKLQNTADLNTIKTLGVYTLSGVTTNKPLSSFNDSMALFVFRTANNGNLMQIAFDSAVPDTIALREGGSTWGGWNILSANTIIDLQNRLTTLENTVKSLQSSTSSANTTTNNKINTAIDAIIDKVYGGGTFDSSTGNITWPNSSKIPVGNLNIYSAGGSGNTFNNAIRSRAGDTDGDIKVN